MARIISSTIELSGKLGGDVYARNKGGAYVRKYTIPINPRSLGQLAVRAAWASAVTSWHALSDEQKAKWNQFVVAYFKPKYPKIGVAYSGFNTYVSLKNELNQLVRVQTEGTFKNLTYSQIPWSNVILEPPEKGISSQILIANVGPSPNYTPTSITLKSANIIMNESGNSIKAFFRLGTEMSPDIVPIFLDASSQRPVGIVLMQSYPMTQKNQFTINPKYSFAAAIQAIDVVGGTNTGYELEVTAPLFTGDKKFTPKLGEIIELNAFLTSVDGLTQPIGTVKTIVGVI
jgi:hypothetical protein